MQEQETRQEQAEHDGTSRNRRKMQDQNGQAGPRRNRLEYAGTTRKTHEHAGSDRRSRNRRNTQYEHLGTGRNKRNTPERQD